MALRGCAGVELLTMGSLGQRNGLFRGPGDWSLRTEGAALPRGSTAELTPLSYPGPGVGAISCFLGASYVAL